MATTVGQHPVSSFTSPINGDPLNADVVRSNDNTTRVAYVDHDADPGIHVQSSTLASRPLASVAGDGAKWITTDAPVRLWISNGSAWSEVSQLTDGDKGDITVSASGATWTIDAGVVSTSKMGGDVTTAGKALLDDADASAQRTTLGLGTLATQNGTFSGTSSGTNTGDVTLAGTPDYITIAGQTITRGLIDLTTDVTGDLPFSNVTQIATDTVLGRSTAGTGDIETIACTAAGRALLDDADAAAQRTTLGLGTLATQSGTFSGTSSGTNTGDVSLAGTPDYITISGQTITRGLVDLATDITGDLPLANLTQASAATRLLGRGSAAGAGDYEEITLGSNLSMSGTVLSASAGGVTDGDKGDITVSGSGATWTIDNSVVTYAKIQNVSATDRILGRSTAGAGVVEEIACTAAGRALIDDADATAQRTTLGLGTLATASSVNLATQVTGDLPLANLAQAGAASRLLGRGSAAGAGDYQDITLGTGLSMSGTTLSATGVGDVVGDDTLTTVQNIVAYNTTGGKNITELTGTQGDVLYHNGTSWAKLAAGTSGNYLKTNGAAANPAWSAVQFADGTAAAPGAAFASDTNVGLFRPGADILGFTTAGTERAQFSASGYLKVAPNGSYRGPTVGYHEFTQTTATGNMVLRGSSATPGTALVLEFSGASPDNNTTRFLGCSDTTTDRCIIYSDGDLANHDGTYGTISDVRLKQDIIDATSQWDDIKAVRFRKYRMKTDVAADPNAPYMLGVVAQEIQQTSPGLVDEHLNDDGTTTMSVKSSILLTKAAVALQEALLRIEALEAKVAALEAV